MSIQWPKIRYESNNETLSNNLAPVFPDNLGERFYSTALDNPTYMRTEREVPTTNLSWNTSNTSKADRDTLWDFYDTNLLRGEYDFTLIDHRKRMLFDVSWHSWQETWKKMRGGVFDINMNLESHQGWVPTCFGSYFITTDSLADHCLETASDLTIGADGSYGNGFKNNGSALVVDDNAGSAPLGASNTGLTTWDTQKGYNSISLLGQFNINDLNTSAPMYLMKVSDGTNYIRLEAEDDGANKKFKFIGYNGSTTTVTSTTDYDESDWYDLCGTYDAINSIAYLYMKPSADRATVWLTTDDMMDGVSALTDVLDSATSTNFPDQSDWTEAYLFEGSQANNYDGTLEYSRGQSFMFIDDFIPLQQFEYIRKLWHMFNRKTTQWPK